MQVRFSKSVRLDFTLTVGQVSESISVEASAVSCSPKTPTVGTVIDNKRIVELPLNGRNYLQLVALTPNATTLSPSAGQAGRGRAATARANRSRWPASASCSTNFTLDGVNNTDPNFNTYVVLPSIDALQEFKVQTGVYPAEFGHNSTQINVFDQAGRQPVSRRAVRIPAQRQVRREAVRFHANPPGESPFKWNQYGFELDGPVRIPKTVQRPRQAVLHGELRIVPPAANFNGIYTVPTAAMFGGDFSGVSALIYDPAIPRRRFPATSFPSNRIDPISKKLLNYYAACQRRDAAHLQQLPARRQRTDQQRPVHLCAWTLWNRRNRSGPAGIAGATRISRIPESRWTARKTITNFEQYMGSNTRTFSPELVNEARFGYTRFFNSTGTYLAFTKDVVERNRHSRA